MFFFPFFFSRTQSRYSACAGKERFYLSINEFLANALQQQERTVESTRVSSERVAFCPVEKRAGFVGFIRGRRRRVARR